MSRPLLPGPSRGLRIGLFGGSFNPAHSGHFHVASTALRRLQLDWVWWIVARGNPLKTGHGDFGERFWSAAAIADHPRMRVTDIEQRLSLTYTHRTLLTLTTLAPDTRFVWLMGADNMVNFHLWGEWQQIAKLMPIAIVARPGIGPGARNSPFARRFGRNRIEEAAAPTLADRAPPAWVFLKAPLDPISSTALRQQKAGT